MTAITLPPREEIPQQHTWNVESIFPDRQAWEAELRHVREMLKTLQGYRGRLGEGPQRLGEWFATVEQLQIALGKVYTYAECCYAVDTTDQQAGAMLARAEALQAEAIAATAFAQPEMLAIGIDTLQEWAQQEETLAIYAHYFDSLGRLAAHIREPEVEEILGQAMEPFGAATAIHSVLADADLTFEPANTSAPQATPVPIGQGNIDALLTHPDRELRRTAWEHYADAHLAHKNTMAQCLLTGVKQHVFLARARRFASALEAALAPNHIPMQVYYNVLNTFRHNLSIWHRYWRVRKKALGYEKLYEYDLKAPLTNNPPRVPLENAITWICEGMRPLGKEYVEMMRQGVLTQRWVDVYPNRGKASGAFSTGRPGTLPFVLMSYTDDLYSLSTLAHELGHSMHSYYSWRSQPLVYADYAIFVAEVASNLNQALVREYLFQTQPERDFQIALIEEAMSNMHRYLFLMPTLARFELAIHEQVERGEAPTADSMMELLTGLFAEGYGGQVEIDPPRQGITWAAFHTHLYHAFYVYQYTTGIAAAQALAEDILRGGQDTVERYHRFLGAGSSLYPLEVLGLTGLDLTTPEPIQRAYDYLDRLITRLDHLVGQAA